MHAVKGVKFGNPVWFPFVLVGEGQARHEHGADIGGLGDSREDQVHSIASGMNQLSWSRNGSSDLAFYDHSSHSLLSLRTLSLLQLFFSLAFLSVTDAEKAVTLALEVASGSPFQAMVIESCPLFLCDLSRKASCGQPCERHNTPVPQGGEESDGSVSGCATSG